MFIDVACIFSMLQAVSTDEMTQMIKRLKQRNSQKSLETITYSEVQLLHICKIEVTLKHHTN